MEDKGRDILGLVWTFVRMLVWLILVSSLAYTVIALVHSTSEERRLEAENEEAARLYPELQEEIERIGVDMERLSRKDGGIYKDIFRSDPPASDPVAQLGIFFGNDSIPDSRLVDYTAEKSDRLIAEVAQVDSLFVQIASVLGSEGFVPPPMSLPLDSLHYTRVGAGVGTRTNPFYTTPAAHYGIDFIASEGTAVLAAGAGTVEKVSRSRKGAGNSVVIRHPGGYRTVYSHLREVSVHGGQSLKARQQIGTAGMSGSTYAPHLHYEVWRDTLVLDPLGYVFASVTPEDYSNMTYISEHTQQSMD